MLQISYIRDNKEEVINRLAIKNFEAKEIVSKIIDIDVKRRDTQKQLDDSLAEANNISKEIGILYKSGKADEANKLKDKTSELKQFAKETGDKLSIIEKELNALLIQLPNLPHASINKGKTPEDNVIVYEEGDIVKLNENALPHWELATKYGIIDFERGVKITGSGFPVYKGKGAKLQRALINFFLDSAVEAGFTEIEPPVLINEESAYATGQLPDKEGQMYFANLDNLYLVPTAEVPVTNLYRDEILKADELLLKTLRIHHASEEKPVHTARMLED